MGNKKQGSKCEDFEWRCVIGVTVAIWSRWDIDDHCLGRTGGPSAISSNLKHMSRIDGSYLVHGDSEKDGIEEEDDDDRSDEGESEAILMSQPAEALRSVTSRVVQNFGDDDGNRHNRSRKSVSTK